MKRLYIGGLGHTVSEKDLKDRFGKFGDVSDVEIVTRKDENGAPLKRFGYININITDAEYKRCVGILNKSTWKGGTLLIQLAKESFLHRLAEERQQLVEKAKAPKIIPQEKLVDSFKAAGVENFHMKAAVPGTEIPGHANWVVSKFGRVLPVVNLKGKGKNKVFKYDPSKHCHNIKRLETADDVTSVSKLTWEIKGGDDEISKKRRGEFPKQKPCPKRSKIDLSLFLSNLAQRNAMNAAATGNKNKVAIQQNGLSAVKTGKQKSVCVFDNDSDSEDEIRMLVAQEHLRNPKQTSTEDDDDNLEVVGDDFVVKSNAFWGGVEQDDMKTSLLTSTKDDEEYDSADTDEILTRRKTQTQAESAPVTQDSPTESSKNKSSSESDEGSDEADDEDDVSVDSDYEAMMGNCYRLDLSLADLEQLAKKAEVISDDESVEEPKEEAKTPSAPPKKTGNNPEDILASLLGDDTPEKESKKKKNQVNTVSLPAFIGTKDLFGGPEPSLKRLAPNIDGESSKRLKQDLKLKEQSISEDTQSSNRLSQQKLSTLNIQTASKKLESKASISEDDSSSEESESSGDEDVFTSKTSSASQSVVPETDLKTVSSNNSKTPIKPNQTKTSRSSSSDSSSEESESSEDDDNEDSAGVLTSKKPSVAQSVKTISKTQMKTVISNNSKSPIKPNQTKTSRSSSSGSSSEESESSEEEDIAKVLTSKTSLATPLARTIPETELKTVSTNNSIKPKQTSRSSSSDSSSEESETSDDENSRTQTKDSKSDDSKNVQENVVLHQTVPHSTVIDAKKQQQDNQKRLAALEQRQKETEQQKKLIQGALSNVDAAKVNKSKHIVFDSDEDDEEEDETTSRPEQPPTNLKKSLFEDDSGSDEDQQTSMLEEKKNNKPGGSKLFDSEDEDDGAEDEQFQIKPQFEGKAGQKLMELQASFGTDSRFQVDSRFLESDAEPEDQDEAAPEEDADKQLLEEKKKSLDILQSILNTNIQPQNTRKGKMFKDVSSLHYDPTQEEHTAFEAKTEEPKKESKAARRKKRIEAEKLPEVSKDVYFDISVDLKEVFGTSKENQDKKETVSWDKEAEDPEDIMKHMEVSFTSNAEANEDTSGGFKFSFFGEDTAVETTTKTDEYKIETVKGAKFSWQADPRFQDSSSDEEEVDEVEEDQSASNEITEEPTTSKKTFFFFYQNDERLKEGPGMFCRSVKLQDQREAWEEKRTSLREECRKKHRDAKRRQRPSLKT
uniref:Nucleolar protein 8 n=1 Tax=Cyprinus carpio TaxID=7962 RepID=A0A8C2GBJ6_CYPCA